MTPRGLTTDFGDTMKTSVYFSVAIPVTLKMSLTKLLITSA
ncbi:hypothetical protein JCM19237_1467 [Photobacterium aphoticum]|uniref:Uncharacterized protein n=1 Tax=Photobacterium aphoticum TaxID=754436 RepID=A0A090RJ62_9GAMM|nr:hypothetical protein JCM19237_1467 [Photobacterium aphoticum]